MKLFRFLKNINRRNAVCYYRCSQKTKRQFLRQKYICEKYAEEKSYKIVKEFTEIISGNSKFEQRDGIIECITYCIKNNIKTVLISEIDRFSRNVTTAKDILSMADPFKINFIFIQEGMSTRRGKNNIDKIMEEIEFSHAELKKIRQRVESGYNDFIKNGGKVGRKKGCTKTKEEFEKDYRDIIRLLFEEQDGYSLRRIAEKCGVCVNTVVKIKKMFENDYVKKIYV